MSNSILLDPRRETLPIIRTGDYEFAWSTLGDVAITNRSAETKIYSIAALNQISESTGMPIAIRSMAWAALDWIKKNPWRKTQ